MSKEDLIKELNLIIYNGDLIFQFHIYHEETTICLINTKASLLL